MKIPKSDMLIGNDILDQLGDTWIKLLENPIDETTPQQVKLLLQQDVVIPAKSSARVVVDTEPKMEIEKKSWVVEPSTQLFINKGVSLGHSIITSLDQIIVANLTIQTQVLPAGTNLARIEELVTEINAVTADPTSSDAEEDITERINPELPLENKNKMNSMLLTHRDCFARGSEDLGHCKTLSHAINTGEVKPIHQAPYPSAFKQRAIIQDQVDDMLKNGVIEPSHSPWSSPVILVKKKDGSFRFCADYRKLNTITVKDVYPLPRIDDALSRLAQTQFYSIMDMQSGFWQIELAPEAKEKTAFITPDGLWQFKKMPFGLCNAPATFQRVMDMVLMGLKWDACLIYLDDVVVFSKTFDEHLDKLDKVLTAIQQAGLRLKI